jgi:hypothetical protein
VAGVVDGEFGVVGVFGEALRGVFGEVESPDLPAGSSGVLFGGAGVDVLLFEA